MNCNLLLIRHGESAVPKGTFIGHTDATLSEIGILQAEALGPLVARFKPEVIATSPLLRAGETMTHACRGVPAIRVQNAGLAEINFGRWEGLSYEEVNRDMPSLVCKWVENEGGFAFPGGESVSSFHRRVDQTISKILNQQQRSFALFTHGGVIRSALCHLLNLPRKSHWVFDIHCGRAAAVQIRGAQRRMVAFNITSPEELVWDA